MKFSEKGLDDYMNSPSPEEKLLKAIIVGPGFIGYAAHRYDNDNSIPIRNEADGVTLEQTIASVLAELTERERLVIHKRFGFDEPAESLTEVGLRLNVTRERVRQIEGKALRKLRYWTRARRLRPYLIDESQAQPLYGKIDYRASGIFHLAFYGGEPPKELPSSIIISESLAHQLEEEKVIGKLNTILNRHSTNVVPLPGDFVANPVLKIMGEGRIMEDIVP